MVGKLHRDLGWSCSETQELDAVSTFNNGFDGSFPGPDGQALFSANHPLYKAGGVQSNVLSVPADLDMIPLQLMLTQFSLQRRPSGEFIHAAPRNLVIHPSNLWLAHALTKSTDDPTTADRSINPLGAAPDGIPKPFAWRYLTDTDAWFLTCPNRRAPGLCGSGVSVRTPRAGPMTIPKSGLRRCGTKSLTAGTTISA